MRQTSTITHDSFFKKSFILLIKFSISALIIWVLIRTSQLQFQPLIILIDQPAIIASISLLFMVMILANAWRWYRLNSAQNIQLGFLKTFFITYFGTAFNNIFPGNIGGDIVRTYYLFRKMPQQKSSIILSVFFDRIMGLMGIFIIISMIAIFQLSLFNRDKNLFYILLICMGFSLSGLIIFCLSLLFPQETGISHWLNMRFPERTWAQSMLSFLKAIDYYRQAKWVIFECLVASIIIQLLMVVTILMLAQAMHFPRLSLADYMVALGVTQIANLIPAAPGGLGIGEMAFSKVLLLMNPALPAAYATIFIAYRLIGILVYLPGILSATFWALYSKILNLNANKL